MPHLCLSEGKDVLIISEEQDRFVVVAGTFKKLVEQLACEEKPGIPSYAHTVHVYIVHVL